jgi:hypothetical protein
LASVDPYFIQPSVDLIEIKDGKEWISNVKKKMLDSINAQDEKEKIDIMQ